LLRIADKNDYLKAEYLSWGVVTVKISSRRKIFSAKLSERSANLTSVILRKQKYDHVITSVLSVKNNGKKISTDFWLLKSIMYSTCKVFGNL